MNDFDPHVGGTTDEALLRALQVGGAVRRSQLHQALAVQLKVTVTGHGSAAWSIVEHMVGPLSDALHDGYDVLDQRPPQIVRAAIEDMGADGMVSALCAFGWGFHKVAGRVDQLDAKLADALVEHLTPKVAGLLRRWEHEGHFEWAARAS